MSSSDTSISRDDAFAPTVQPHKSTAFTRPYCQPRTVRHANPNVYHQSLHPQAAIFVSPLKQGAPVAACTAQPDTQFKYLGSAEQHGWEPGQVPLFLEWFPEKLDRRSSLKFFESGREYTMGRSPNCNFFFTNTEVDSGISALHLKIKTLLVNGPVNKIFVWVTDTSTNGTYINGEKMIKGETSQLSPDDHITLLKRDNGIDSRPNIGFRIIMALRKPKLEDQYRLLQGGLLGAGTFGAVHKAIKVNTDRIVAVKTIRSLHGSNISQDLEREIRIMKKLDHPNIVQFHDSFEETKEQAIIRYIVMEFVGCGTLHEFIQTSLQTPEVTVRHIILQILSALEYMHERHHVSHRDLKPANILLCDRGLYPTVKIADLGLAKIEAASKANTHCGSPGYLAPECTRVGQANGLNWAMDIYAVGVIAYEILTGKRPFSTNLNENPYDRQIPTAPLRLRKCSDAAMNFVNWLLSVNPNQRPSARDSLQHPWVSQGVDDEMASTRVQQILPPTEIMASPSRTIRATPRLPSPDSDESFGSTSSASLPSSSSITSADSEEERTISAPNFPPPPSFFSNRMDICSVRSDDPCIPEAKFSVKRPVSPMRIDTMKPSSKVWCILYPLPKNTVGKTTLFLTKPTTTVGSDTSRDIVLRHRKISDRHCAIMSGAWDKELGFTGIIHVQDKAPAQFQHRSTIYILDEQNEHIGYIVKFPGWDDKDLSMTLAMNHLNISSHPQAKKRANHLFSPYTPSTRRSLDSSATMRSAVRSQADTIPFERSKSIECAPSEDETNLKPWGTLISKTHRKPDVVLVGSSTGLGKVSAFIDTHTGERIWDFYCRVFRLPTGELGVRAIKPVFIGDKCIMSDKWLSIKNEDQLVICEEDMSVIVRYELTLLDQIRPDAEYKHSFGGYV